jgi:hypothetical protein
MQGSKTLGTSRTIFLSLNRVDVSVGLDSYGALVLVVLNGCPAIWILLKSKLTAASQQVH